MQHEALESTLLLRPALNYNHITIAMHRHKTSHEKLVGVCLHLEAMGGIRKVSNSKKRFQRQKI